MSLFKINHIGSFQIFQVLKYSGQLLINIALAKTALSTTDLGKFEFFLFIASSVSFFWVTGIMQALLSLFSDKKNNKSSLFLSSGLLLFVFSIASFLFVLFVLKPSSETISVYQKNILLLYLLINPIGFLTEHILLLNQKFRKLIFFGIISFLAPTILISLPVFYKASINFSLYGLTGWAALKLMYVCFLIIRYSRFYLNTKEIRQLFGYALPLIGTSLVAGSAAYIDGFIVTNYYDSETFAIFRYGAKEFPLFLIVASAFSNSMIPEVAREGNLSVALNQIKKSSARMMHWFFPIAIVLLLTSQHLFPVVFNENFSESYKVFDIYLLLIISRFIFAQTILIGLKKQKTVFWVSIAELLVNVASSLIFVQYFGYLGVAYGTVVGYLFEKTFLSIAIEKKNGMKFRNYTAFKELIIWSIILILGFMLKKVVLY